eukprot:TRINITY_DN5510_c0_g1_i5.p1 TRINITY_DN5510_c0_g1~~TRINITY_DN5510_c0_g1_i5.p1  ORF type:complete len:331 (+),score=4.87 TRINITY_DN5510_c0_g1_i5:66-1058(+)
MCIRDRYSDFQYHVSCRRIAEPLVRKTIQELRWNFSPNLPTTRETCKICLQTMNANTSFSFMTCGHHFCRMCATEHAKQSCFDRSNFPLRCPECSDLICVEDIKDLVSQEEFKKLIKIALEEYATANANSGRKIIPIICKGEHCGLVFLGHSIIGQHVSCSHCSLNHCSQCLDRDHPGYTCDEFRNVDFEFEQYSREAGVKKCPNPSCGAHLQKDGGCLRIICPACNHAICWACLEYFKVHNDCYPHLTRVHGGFYDANQLENPDEFDNNDADNFMLPRRRFRVGVMGNLEEYQFQRHLEIVFECDIHILTTSLHSIDTKLYVFRIRIID